MATKAVRVLRAAVAHERQRDAGDRHDAHGHPDVLEDLEHEHRQDADADERAELVAGQLGGAPDPPDDDRAAGARRVPAPMKPSSSPTAVKMKSVCCSGTMSRRVWVPLNRPWPAEAARRRWRSCDCSRLYSAPPLGALLVLRLEERREPALLELLEHAGAEDHRRRRRSRRAVSTAMWRAWAPPTSSMPIDDGDEHQRGAEVGLEHDQRHRDAGGRRARWPGGGGRARC